MKKSKPLMFSFALVIATVFNLMMPFDGGAACPDGIAAYWKLDETTASSYADFIGANDAATGAGDPAPATTEGINGAQQFVATDPDGLDVSANHVFNWTSTESFSIELWVKTNGAVVPGSNQVLIGRDDAASGMQWWIGLQQTTGNASFYFQDGDGSGGTGTSVSGVGLGASLTDGIWHHVVFVRNGSTGDNILYVDDNDTAATTVNQGFTNGFISDDATLNIGYLKRSPFYYFDGFIDEVAIYSRVLTPTEIAAHRTSGIDYCGGSDAPSDAPFPDNTVSLWHLDESGGSTYVDFIGANNAATGAGDPAPATTEGINGAQQFVATDPDGLDVSANHVFNWTSTESFSIELWVKTNGAVVPGSNQVLIGRDDAASGMQWWIGLQQTTGNASFYFQDGDGSGGTGTSVSGVGLGASLTDGIWHHVVFVRNGSTGDNILYVDDNDTAATTVNQGFTNGFISDDATLNIGYLKRSPFYYFDGFIDEVAIYSRVLTPTEIAAHRTAGASGNSVDSLRPAPTANAGNDVSTTEGATVTLNGTASSTYAGETITGYVWTQTAGTTTVTLDTTVPSQPTFTAPAVAAGGETYTFSLTVTASDGQSSATPATVNVVVADSTAPTANAGPAQSVTEGDTVTLNGSGSTPAVPGATLTYAWTQTDATGLTVTLSDATAVQPTFTAPNVTASTTLTFQLIVTENSVSSAPATVNITVGDVATSPDADAGPDQAVTEGATVTLDGSGSLPATVGATLTYSWTQTDTSGFTVTLSDATVVSPTFTAPDVTSAGATLTFQLTVTEGSVTSTDSVNIVVNDAASTGGGGGGGGCFIDSLF